MRASRAWGVSVKSDLYRTGSICFSIFYSPHIFFQPRLEWHSILQLLCYSRLNVAQIADTVLLATDLRNVTRRLKMCTRLAPGPTVEPGCVLPQAFGRKGPGHCNCGDGGRLGPAQYNRWPLSS